MFNALMIRKMHIKTTIKYHSSSVTMSASKRQKTMGAGKDTKNRKPFTFSGLMWISMDTMGNNMELLPES